MWDLVVQKTRSTMICFCSTAKMCKYVPTNELHRLSAAGQETL